LCAAIIDRLTFDSNIIETGIGAYRLTAACVVRASREKDRCATSM
jgi:hypothetical protein